jgi:hypothetical protein
VVAVSLILNFIIKSCGLKIQEYIMKSKNNNKLQLKKKLYL